jgi:hypothetical protein
MIQTAASWSRPVRCLRHRVWLSSCDDCTAWHLTRLLTARDATVLRPRTDHSAPALQAAA